MIKKIDLYLIRLFVSKIFFGLLAFIFIFVIIDMMENLDDFVDQSAPVSVVFYYYLVFTPEIIRLILPVSLLLSALLTTGKLAELNELTAIKSSGISLYRYMTPFLIVVFVIGIFSIYFSGYVVPEANKVKTQIEQTHLKRGFVFAGSNIFFQDNESRIINIAFFDFSQLQANRISIQEFDKDDITKMTSRIDAPRMNFDTTANLWIAQNGIKRIFHESTVSYEPFSSKEIDYLNFVPRDVMFKQQKLHEMNLTELYESIKNQYRAGTDATRMQIEYHSRISFAATNIIVLLLGLPLAAQKRRGGVALLVGISIGITFIYLVFYSIVQALGKNGVLDPLPTAWFANAVFFVAALLTLIVARK